MVIVCVSVEPYLRVCVINLGITVHPSVTIIHIDILVHNHYLHSSKADASSIGKNRQKLFLRIAPVTATKATSTIIAVSFDKQVYRKRLFHLVKLLK